MKKTIIAGIACLLHMSAFAQTQPDSSEIESLNEILISSQRMGGTRGSTTRQIEVIKRAQIDVAQQPTTAEILSQSGKVFVQKSQLGGGSPVLRGFEASRVLLVMDGVRMNNATYRAGHLQDLVTVDPFMLDKMEVFFGSGSTQFGSDALGGVIYMKTRTPEFRDNQFGFAGANATMRYMSASNAKIANVNFTLSGRKIAWLVNLTQSDFGDLRSGQQQNYSGNDTFGWRGYYIDRINGRDTQLKNMDPFKQIGTGYNQTDAFTKLAVQTGGFLHILNLQVSHSSVIHRYDRLTDIRNGALRYATWDYAPQNRNFLSYTLLFPTMGKVSQRVILSTQSTELGRVTRSFKSATEKTQLDKVNMSALNYDLSAAISDKLRILGGLEVVSNKVTSTASNRNVNTDVKTDIKDTRYADGGASTFSAAAYTNVVYTVIPNDFTVEGGLRFTSYSLEANFSSDNILKLPYAKAEISSASPVFNLGISKKMDVDGLFFKASLASGMRSPNVDDMTKLFESAGGNKLIVPNKDLKPEYSRTLDLGLVYNSETWQMEIGGFYTKIKDLLMDQVATYNGADSVLYDGKMTKVYQMANTAVGYATGAYFNAKAKLCNSLYGDVSYTTTYGRYRATENSAWAPLDHVSPDYGRAGIRYVSGDWQAEGFVLFNGWKRAKDYSPSGEDNAQYSPGGKTPSWQTYNLRALWHASKYISASFAVENILDLHYRTFSSGISAPGRNIIVSLKVSL